MHDFFKRAILLHVELISLYSLVALGVDGSCMALKYLQNLARQILYVIFVIFSFAYVARRWLALIIAIIGVLLVLIGLQSLIRSNRVTRSSY